MASGDEDFLARWSRLKRKDAAKPAAESGGAQPAPAPGIGEAAQPVAAAELPPIDSLTLGSDYRAFLQPGVAADLRKAALKKLFSDPHFHFAQMDKLDTYIDDYTQFEPISDEMMKTIDHARHILFDKEPVVEDAAGGAGAATAGEFAADAPQPDAEEARNKNGDPRQDA